MDSAPDIATTTEAWLQHFGAGPLRASGTHTPYIEIGAPANPSVLVPALAALAAEALAHDRVLRIVTADDSLLPDISNALDLRLRPLCLVLPGADYAGRIALRATLSLLKSRLTRAGDDSDGPAWAAMRTRLGKDDALWRTCLAWGTRGLDRELPPADIATLFPVCIGPWTLAEKLAFNPDWVMLVQAGQLPDQWRTPWPGARKTVVLSGRPVGTHTGLVILDETARLRAELEVLGQELAEMELELATAQAEIAGFAERYGELIAGRMAELDRLQAELACIRMAQAPQDTARAEQYRQAEARAEQSRREQAQAGRRHAEGSNDPRFAPSNDMKKRFRQLAQKIHPDRAQDEADRAWRTQLMSEANRAYRSGDIAALDEVLALWLEGKRDHTAVPPAPTFAGKEKLTAEVEQIRRRIAGITAELDRLYGSKLYELFTASRLAARQGRDLLEEMADRIDLQISLAQDEIEVLEIRAAA
jgi:hypothetical protein